VFLPVFAVCMSDFLCLWENCRGKNEVAVSSGDILHICKLYQMADEFFSGYDGVLEDLFVTSLKSDTDESM
jgi:hypothetical protein